MVRIFFKTTLRKLCLSKLLPFWPKGAKVAKADVLLREAAKISPWKQLFHFINNMCELWEQRAKVGREDMCFFSLRKENTVIREWCFLLNSFVFLLSTFILAVLLCLLQKPWNNPSLRSFMQVLEDPKDPTCRSGCFCLTQRNCWFKTA